MFRQLSNVLHRRKSHVPQTKSYSSQPISMCQSMVVQELNKAPYSQLETFSIRDMRPEYLKSVVIKSGINVEKLHKLYNECPRSLSQYLREELLKILQAFKLRSFGKNKKVRKSRKQSRKSSKRRKSRK